MDQSIVVPSIVTYKVLNACNEEVVLTGVEISRTKMPTGWSSIVYTQNRLIKVWEYRDSSKELHYQIISKYCEIPEYDRLLDIVINQPMLVEHSDFEDLVEFYCY